MQHTFYYFICRVFRFNGHLNFSTFHLRSCPLWLINQLTPRAASLLLSIPPVITLRRINLLRQHWSKQKLLRLFDYLFYSSKIANIATVSTTVSYFLLKETYIFYNHVIRRVFQTQFFRYDSPHVPQGPRRGGARGPSSPSSPHSLASFFGEIKHCDFLTFFR